MDDFIREAVADRAAGNGHQAAAANTGAEKQYFADPRQTEELTPYSLKIIDELSKQGRPLP